MKRTLLLPALLIAVTAHAQNDCASAPAVVVGTYVVDTVDGAAPAINCFGNINPIPAAEWYVYSPTDDYALTVSTELLPGSLPVDTRVSIYQATSCASMICLADDDDAGPGNLSLVTTNVQSGYTYYLVFDGYYSQEGFSFTLAEGPPIVEPPTMGYTPVPGVNGTWGAVDMNGDHLDDVVAPGSSTVTVMYQNADNGFNTLVRPTTTTVRPTTWSFCVGDIDKNGYNDMMYGNGNGATFMMANADGSAFTESPFPQYIFCQRTNMVDLDNDGDLDAFSCHDVDANVYFSNDGTGALTFHQGGLGPTCGNYGSIWIDYDNDGDQDLFIAKCGCDPVDLFMRNDGDMAFNSVAAEYGFQDSQQSWSSAWGDFDNDGDMDVLVGASSGVTHKLMRNDGTGFTNVTPGSGLDVFTGQSIEWVTHDFNNDGYLDILGGNGYLEGHGDMTFSVVEITPTNGPVGDLNHDGFMDIVNGAQIYLNNGNDNHWLTIATVGTTSNVNGIGARVEITSALGTQIRDVRSGDGFHYMSSLNTHFGLGTDSVITNLTIRWPSGLVTSLNDVPVDTMLVVVEGVSTNVRDLPESGLELYPSPAQDLLFVRNAQDLGTRAVRVMDASGKLVLRSTLRNGTLDVSALNSGLYLLQIDGGVEVLKGKFIKQ